MVALIALLLAGCGSSWRPVDVDGDGLGWAEGDCDDADPAIGPHAQEIWYDGVDQNCDGADDFDADGDGFVSDQHGGTDCHDDNNQAFPGWVEIWYDCFDNDCAGNDGDQDGDGFIPDAYAASCPDWRALNPGLRLGDCWDDPDDPFAEGWVGQGQPPTPERVNPDARDTWYDGVDEDCDGASDFDADGDGFDRDEECDDADPTRFPDGSPQIWYNCVDEGCGGDDGDQDGDGFVEESYSRTCPNWRALNPGLEAGDCDDTSPEVNPGAAEGLADGLDQDCDGRELCYEDADGDGFAGAGTTTSRDLGCEEAGAGAEALDCDDADDAVHPAATEAPADGLDQDCDGRELCFEDADGDGHGATSTRASADLDCLDPGEAASALDCDDADARVNPGGDETLSCFDGLDQDCDGLVEEGCFVGGELVITELYYARGGEEAWLELTNTSGGRLDLLGMGLSLFDGAPVDTFTATGSLPLGPGDRAVLCKDAGLGHTAAICDLAWGADAPRLDLDAGGGLTLTVLDHAGLALDTLRYEALASAGWPEPVADGGESVELCEDPPTASGNDAGSAWAVVDAASSGALYYTGTVEYLGTPGAPNTCP